MGSSGLVQTIEELQEWISTNGLTGFDPYDALSSPLGNIADKCNPFLGRVIIHLLKNFPFNIRPVLGINREFDAKALGLLARGSFLLGDCMENEQMHEQGRNCIKHLKNTVTRGFSGACWGHPFTYRSSRIYLPANMPSIVSTAYAVQAMLDAYLLDKDSSCLDIAKSSCDFIIRDLPRIGDEHQFVFSYIPQQEVAIHNANLLAAQVLIRVDSILGESNLVELARIAVQTTVDAQNENGSWYYDALQFSDRSSSFIDNFHTGFVLESLLDIYSVTQWDYLETSIRRGFEFYTDNLFHPDGSPRHTVDGRGAVDLRDCAQCMIVLSKISQVFDYDTTIALDHIINWTTKHMKSRNGSFAFSNRRLLNGHIPYIRFQAWMLCALGTVYSNKSSVS